MDKKGVAGSTVVVTVIGIVLVGVLALGVWKIGFAPEQAPVQKTETTITGAGGKELVDCPSSGSTNGFVKMQERLAASLTYDASPTCYFKPETSGQPLLDTGALSASAYSATPTTGMACKSTDPVQYSVVCVTTQDDISSALGSVKTVAGSDVYWNEGDGLKGTAFDVLKVRMKEKESEKYFNMTGEHKNTQDYVALNGTSAVVSNNAETGTKLDLGADGYITSEIRIKTNNSKTQFGEDGLNTWMIVDANSNEFQQPTIFRDGGNTLEDSLASMTEEDRRYYTGYEYAYNIGLIGERESVIDFYVESVGGVDPSTDIAIAFCAEGRYKSVKDADTFKVGCWTDASTQAQIATAKVQRMVLDIS